MYISSNVPRQRGHTVTTIYHLTSFEFRQPSSASLLCYQSGNISYVGGAVSLGITRQQAASILATARELGFQIERKHVTDTVTTVWTRRSPTVHPANAPAPTSLFAS